MTAPASPTDRMGRSLRDLRISVTDRCNFRCPYCMPAEIYGERYEFLPRHDILTLEEIATLAEHFVALGAAKIRITGGEPLVRSNLPLLIRRLAAIDALADLTLTTNGYLLAERAEALAQAGLGRITVSLDSLDEQVFRTMSGGNFSPQVVLEAIAAAARAGLAPIKINCVVQRGMNEEAVLSLAERFRGTGHIVRYIEYMDVGTRNRWNMEAVLPAAEIVARIDARWPLEPLAPSCPGEVATRWRYRDGAGEIGVIASVTRPFCAGCTRARLTTDGRLVTCLFADTGVDLKTPLRAGAGADELRDLIASVWAGRADRYSEQRAGLVDEHGRVVRPGRLEMYQVGG